MGNTRTEVLKWVPVQRECASRAPSAPRPLHFQLCRGQCSVAQQTVQTMQTVSGFILAAQVQPRSIPGASQEHPRCIPDASQVQPRCTWAAKIDSRRLCQGVGGLRLARGLPNALGVASTCRALPGQALLAEQGLPSLAGKACRQVGQGVGLPHLLSFLACRACRACRACPCVAWACRALPGQAPLAEQGLPSLAEKACRQVGQGVAPPP